MGTRYQQLDLEDRCTIARLHGQGHSLRQIAAGVDCAPSTVSRELKVISVGRRAVSQPDRVSIHQRPQEVDDRSALGNWEADLMLFSKYGQAVLTLHDRSSRILFATRPPNKAAIPTAQALLALLQP